MRYVTTIEWLGNKKFHAVWDTLDKKVVNGTLTKNKNDAKEVADSLNAVSVGGTNHESN